MRHSRQRVCRQRYAVTLTTAIALALGTTSALAEGPMNTDDAGTLDQGGMKLEAAYSRDDKARANELVFGFGPIENVEVGLAFSRNSDRADDPATKNNGTGISVKWVPIQNDTGWSLGVGLGFDNARVHKPSFDPTDPDDPERYRSSENSIAGLATYRFENGQVLHMNLGSKTAKENGAKSHAGTWGIGYELPLAEGLQLTAEAFGERRMRADKALGLRYEIADGLKAYGAVGRGNDRSFGNIGVAWEF